MTLDPPSATSDEAGAPLLDEDYLILSTIHSAKGMEWQSVHVLNAADGCIPSDMSTGSQAQIEEERRLFYVALTRAKRHLHVLMPQRFYVSGQSGVGDKHVYGTVSRFLPPAVAALCEACGPTSREAVGPAPSPTIPATTLDVAARLRGNWA